MNTICLYLFVVVLSLSQCEYTMTYLYPLRLGDKATEVKMIVDSKEDQSIVFSNTDKVYAEQILTKTQMDQFVDTVEINGQVLTNFTFEVKEDTTQLNQNTTQGILGIGVSLNEHTNSIFDAMKTNQLVNKRELYITTSPSPKIQFLVDKAKKDLGNFTECALTDRDDLEDKYHSAWVCEYTHIILNNKTEKKELSFNDTFEIHGRALFDTTTSHIIAPIEYYEVIFDLLELNSTICKSIEDLSVNETYISCAFKNQSEVDELNSFFFIFDGYAYDIPSSNLFRNTTSGFISTIKFRAEKNNIWTFGYPFFSQYEVKFDFEEQKVGFKGENVMNFTAEWEQWRIQNENFLKRVYNDKNIMVIGAILGSLILVLILFLIIRAFAKRSPQLHNQLIEEVSHNNA